MTGQPQKFECVVVSGVVLVVFHLFFANAMIEEISIPPRLQECFQHYATKTTATKTVGQSIHWMCTHLFIWRESGVKGWLVFNMTQEAHNWYRSLLPIISKGFHRRKRSNHGGYRIRKEIRMMSNKERDDFFRAIQLLKADTTVPPNKYGALAALHEGLAVDSAHGGPNFLGWHRYFLLMFENALREKVPDVSIPYWDSSLDEPMPDPTQSVIWSEHFMGNGDGIVTTGPFADWDTAVGPLIRNLGHFGELFSKSNIANIMSRKFTVEITEPLGLPEHNLEVQHGEVHNFVDGQLGELSTAAHDPVFYLHHTFVDYLWEQFRLRQRMQGVNPDLDYPTIVNHTLHSAHAPLGFGNLRNIDSYSDLLINGMYEYMPSPTCSHENPDCGSPFLRCETGIQVPYCVSLDRSIFGNTPSFPQRQIPVNIPNRSMHGRWKRQTEHSWSNMAQQSLPVFRNSQTNIDPRQMVMIQPPMSPSVMMTSNMRFQTQQLRQINMIRQNMDTFSSNSRTRMAQTMANNPFVDFSKSNQQQMCPAIPINQRYQNTFNINGLSDVSQWVYLPVKIIYKRPPNFSYGAYPIVNGALSNTADIYSPMGYKNLQQRFRTINLATYDKCRTSGAGTVYVVSNGLNYLGTYKEFAIVDNRMAISLSTTFVAIKSPERGVSEVFLSAFDSCGRICTPYCRNPASTSGESHPCSGAIRVNSNYPKLYSNNYGDAVLSTWNMASGSCPRLVEDQVFVSFYCDYVKEWPLPGEIPTQPPPTPPQPNMHGFMHFAANAIPQNPVPAMVPVQSATAVLIASNVACDVGYGCIIPTSCRPCHHGVTIKCHGTCSLYAQCNMGSFSFQRCIEGGKFDAVSGSCVTGTCPEDEMPPNYTGFTGAPSAGSGQAFSHSKPVEQGGD